MAALMGEIDNSPSMQQQLDAMMAELSTGVSGSESKEAQKAAAQAVQEAAKHVAVSSTEDTGASSAPPADFQETIRRTMERMQASGEQASAAANEASSSSEADMLEALLKEMAAAGGGDGDGAGEEEFSKMLLGMMEQLTNKEILYEPMKDLHDKFPAWLKENEGKVPKTDWDRYLEQQRLVTEIVGRFEREGYTDENPEDREFVVERMQKVSPRRRSLSLQRQCQGEVC
jgi:peroxin-19